jgi:AcrR family transcriptional regulator
MLSSMSTAASTRGPRGPYAKTAARRAQILDVALDVFGRLGYRGGSLREIADRVGVSDTGVLHHFGSKQRLLIAVLEHREALSRQGRPSQEGLALLDGLRGLVAQNASTPGLTQLFVTLSAEATEPDHPAHDFFVARYEDVTQYFVDQLEVARDDGQVSADVDVTEAAQQLIAVMDGLQVQWLLNDKVDMVAAFDQFLEGFRHTLGVRGRARPRGGAGRQTPRAKPSPQPHR